MTKRNYTLLLLMLLFTLSVDAQNVINVGANDNINELINNASEGDIIKLENKIYKLDYTINILGKTGITLEGNGATIIRNSLSSDVVMINNSNKITLRNIKATHIQPSGPVGCTGNVLHIQNSSYVTIEACDLNGSGIVGIAAYDSDNLLAISNHIHENSECAIIFQGQSLILNGNVFEKNGDGNKIWFDYHEKGGYGAWPPKSKVYGNKDQKGLVMINNIFK